MKILIVDDIVGWRNYNKERVSELFDNCEIVTADSATKAYEIILENNHNPFDIIITDMQMENDYTPKHAGEWLIEQIQNLKNYSGTKVVIISATNNIRQIADLFNVQCIPKSAAISIKDAYRLLK